MIQLQQKLTQFGSKLTPELCKEFREILDLFAQAHYEFGEQYKLAIISLIPSNINTAGTAAPRDIIKEAVEDTINSLPSTIFKPAAKQDITSIAIALARNMELNLKQKEKE